MSQDDALEQEQEQNPESFIVQADRFNEKRVALDRLMRMHIAGGAREMASSLETYRNGEAEIADLLDYLAAERAFTELGALGQILMANTDALFRHRQERAEIVRKQLDIATREIEDNGRVVVQIHFLAPVMLTHRKDSPYVWYTFKDGWDLYDRLLRMINETGGSVTENNIGLEDNKQTIDGVLTVVFGGED